MNDMKVVEFSPEQFEIMNTTLAVLESLVEACVVLVATFPKDQTTAQMDVVHILEELDLLEKKLMATDGGEDAPRIVL